MSGVENYAQVRGQRTLRVVQERRCDVCDEDGLMALVMALGLPVGVYTPCPHCGPLEVPIRPLPWRDDTKTRSA